jgi:protein phosphatase
VKNTYEGIASRRSQDLLKIDPVALTHVGRKREHNEDYLGDLIIKGDPRFDDKKLAEKGYLFAVADGMGGYAAGEVASEMAITSLFERFYNAPSNNSIAQDLLQAIVDTNLEVYQAGNAPGNSQMGTTLTVALVKGNRLLVANVGDSRTYLIRNGIPLRVTRDHSLIQEQIDMGALTPEQASKSIIRNIITRAIGHRDEVEPDLFEQELQKGDIILLCSDGLHGLVQEMELGAIVASASNLKQAAQQLIDLANERGGQDNISVLLIGITEVGKNIPSLLGSSTVTTRVPTVENEPATIQVNGQIPTAEFKTVEPSTARMKAAVREDTPTVQTEVPGKKGGGGLVLAIVALLLIAVGAAIVFFLMNNSTGDSTAPTATAAVTPTNTITLVATATAPVATTSTTIAATAGSVPVTTAAVPSNQNVPTPPQTTTVGAVIVGGGVATTPPPQIYTVDRNAIKKVEIWLPKEGWPTDLKPEDCSVKLTQGRATDGIILNFRSVQIDDSKEFYSYQTTQTIIDFQAGTYIVSVLYRDQPASAKGLRFSEKDLRVEESRITANANIKYIGDTLYLVFAFDTTGTRRNEPVALPANLEPPVPVTTKP